jgi:hypothetical protein
MDDQEGEMRYMVIETFTKGQRHMIPCYLMLRACQITNWIILAYARSIGS